ncbi:MAG: hypothetical protein LBU70_04825 [Chitinispirillales bacterium]|jgi:hypothetical protein|nr:hypothetical protein [Chitinispirillales bacterium]
MARKTGVTKETAKRLVLDAGVVYLNLDDPIKRKKLGATRGGSEFVIETEWRDMEFDGVGGLVEGARRAINVTCSLTVNLIEISKEILALAVPGAKYGDGSPAENENGVAVTGETHYEIKRVLEGTIPDFDYNDIAIVAEYAGHKAPIVCGLKNAMANSNLSLTFNDADEAVLAITFTGAFDPENITEEPWFIRIPEKDS